MLRTALRLGILPFWAFLVVWESASGPGLVLRGISLFFMAFLVVPLVVLSYWRFKADPPTGVAPKWARVAAPIIWLLSAVLIVSVVQTDWPLRLSFRANKPQVEELVAAARANKAVKLPQSVGPFYVFNIRAYDDETIIYLNDAQKSEGPVLINRAKTQTVGDGENLVLDNDWVFHSSAD